MSNLHDTMRMMHSLLRGEKKPEELAEVFGADVKRLAVYQKFVKNHVIKTLSLNFSTFHSLIPHETWTELTNEYFATNPATTWQLNACAKNFPDFVAQKIANGLFDGQGFYIELLQFEWEEVTAYCNDIVIMKSEEITQPVLNPTLSVLNLEYPIGTFLSMWRQGKKDDDWIVQKKYLEKEAQLVFICRHPKKHRCYFHTAYDRLLFAFKIVHDNIDIQQAAQISGQSEDSIYQTLLEIQETGIIILPKPLKKLES